MSNLMHSQYVAAMHAERTAALADAWAHPRAAASPGPLTALRRLASACARRIGARRATAAAR